MELFELLILFYQLNGLAWMPEERRATFGNIENARKFIAVAQNWTVVYYQKEEVE